MAVPQPTFDEPDLVAVQRVFDRLLASGEIVAEPNSAEECAGGPTLGSAAREFHRLSRRYSSVRLVLAEITFHLHRCEPVEPRAEPPLGTRGLGDWRLGSDAPELDVRIGHPEAPDMVFDHTWSPKSSRSPMAIDGISSSPGVDDVVVHSTLLHFIVRAAAGNAST